jgi:hypothetical protein
MTKRKIKEKRENFPTSGGFTSWHSFLVPGGWKAFQSALGDAWGRRLKKLVPRWLWEEPGGKGKRKCAVPCSPLPISVGQGLELNADPLAK